MLATIDGEGPSKTPMRQERSFECLQLFKGSLYRILSSKAAAKSAPSFAEECRKYEPARFTHEDSSQCSTRQVSPVALTVSFSRALWSAPLTQVGAGYFVIGPCIIN